jgi:PHS family inorganic phosphate transporter-like MFS transporter
MFLVTGTLFIITGATLLKTTGSQSWGINIALYALCGFSEQFGIAPLTFLLPAELFPTGYRASCHGISAAFGKFGSIVAFVFLRYVTFGEGEAKVTSSNSPSAWLSYVLIIFAIPLFLGAGVCWFWIPELQDPSGKSKTLEQLAEGRRSARSDIVAGFNIS